ncbi:MAG TPA: TonB family protein [Polyangiales bacterium]|nr:TonB family protein [Polyangiales bacterium]
MWSSRTSIGWAISLSALLHLGGVVALQDVPLPSARAAERVQREDYVAQFEPVEPGSAAAGDVRRRSVLPEVIPGHAPSAGAIDRTEAEGRGGERASDEPSALLFPFVSPLTLQDTELNNLAANQAQRIRTAPNRATLEERRATPNAADEVLLASGTTGHHERRAPAKLDAAEGAPRASNPSAPSEPRQGSQPEPGIGPNARLAIVMQEAASAREAADYAPARGIQAGAGKRQTAAAKVAFARPNVDRGPAATTSERLDPQVRDDLDAELLAAKLQRSLVDTSVQRAEQRGLGAGGAPGDQALGLHGAQSGARARSYAPGDGNADALDTRDARYLRWFTQQRERVQKELVFPRERALAMDQGMSLFRVVLDRDGALTGKPRLVRSSGFSDFDAAAKIAIERALPFAPLPKELAPALTEIALLIPINFANPMIR